MTITKKKAACTFYQNALRASRVNDWIKMTRNYLMMRNFSTTNKLASLMLVFPNMFIHFSKRFLTAMHSCKMYIRYLFRCGQFPPSRNSNSSTPRSYWPITKIWVQSLWPRTNLHELRQQHVPYNDFCLDSRPPYLDRLTITIYMLYFVHLKSKNYWQK